MLCLNDLSRKMYTFQKGTRLSRFVGGHFFIDSSCVEVGVFVKDQLKNPSFKVEQTGYLENENKHNLKILRINSGVAMPFFHLRARLLLLFTTLSHQSFCYLYHLIFFLFHPVALHKESYSKLITFFSS